MLLLSCDWELVDEGRGPIEALGFEETAEESFGAMLFENGVDQLLADGIGRAAEGKSDRPQTQLKQPVAMPGLQVVVPLRRCGGDQRDLTVIEAEALVDGAGLWLDGPVIRQEDPLWAAFDDGGRDHAARDISQGLGGE